MERYYIIFIKLLFTFIFCLKNFSFTSIYKYKIVEINQKGLNSRQIAAFTNSLIYNFLRYNFFYLNNEEMENPDYLLFFDFEFRPYNEQYHLSVTVRSFTNKNFILGDSIYTSDLWGTLGFEKAGKDFSKRIFDLIKGRRLKDYREVADYRKYYTKISNANRPVLGYEMFDFMNFGFLYNEGINSENNFGVTIKILEYSRIFMVPNTPLGIGFGIGILDIHNTNTGGILPLTIYVPIYIFPDNYEFNRKNIFLAAEWCGLLPRYSYYDISLRFYYNGIGVKFGWMYYPAVNENGFSRSEKYKFYGGIFFYIGSFKIYLGEKIQGEK